MIFGLGPPGVTEAGLKNNVPGAPEALRRFRKIRRRVPRQGYMDYWNVSYFQMPKMRRTVRTWPKWYEL